MLRSRSKSAFIVAFVLISSCYWPQKRSWADAPVVTKAMTASTIAEIFVEQESVRVSLEIGASDLLAFHGILPDEILEKLVPDSAKYEERLEAFFREGFVRGQNGDPLPGKVETLQARPRIVRDEITGDPLIEQPADAELVVVAELRYGLAGKPSRISIQPPATPDPMRSANIGFVAYHGGLPINDFRYLAGQATLELNWDDPWYSRFHNRNLWRQNAAPMSAYLYVEPFEVRKEIIVRPKDLQRFLDLGLENVEVIPVDQQAKLKNQISQFLADKNPVLIDGQAKPGQLDRIHFVRRTLRRTGIVDPPEDLDVTSATLGVIFVYPIDRLPNEVTMEWELFNGRIQAVPSSASDEAGPLPSTLTPEDPVLRWKNFLKDPTSHKFASIAPPPSARRVLVPVVTLACAVSLLPLSAKLIRSYKHAGRVSGRASMVCIAIALVGWLAAPYAKMAIANPFASPPPLADAVAEEILAGLLHNVYRAFDRRDQGLIYDRLSRSIAGDLLEQVYLDTRRSIEVENQGGLQIKVTDVTVLELERISATASELTFRCRWRVAGSVGHWGHVHMRVNEPAAEVTIAAVNGAWKIVAMEMMHE